MLVGYSADRGVRAEDGGRRTEVRGQRSGVGLSGAEVFGDGLGAGADVEFFEDALDVGMDGAVADGELLGNFFVEVTFGEEIQDLLFAGRKVFGLGDGRGGLLEGLDYFSSDVTGHGSAAGVDVFNG